MIFRDYFNELNGRLKSNLINNFIDDVNTNTSQLLLRLQHLEKLLAEFKEIISLQNSVTNTNPVFMLPVSTTTQGYTAYFEYGNIVTGGDASFFPDSMMLLPKFGTIENYMYKNINLYEIDSLDPDNYNVIQEFDLSTFFEIGIQTLKFQNPSSPQTPYLLLDFSSIPQDTISYLKLNFLPFPNTNIIALKPAATGANDIQLNPQTRLFLFKNTYYKRFMFQINAININSEYKAVLNNIAFGDYTLENSTKNFSINFIITPNNFSSINFHDLELIGNNTSYAILYDENGNEITESTILTATVDSGTATCTLKFKMEFNGDDMPKDTYIRGLSFKFEGVV